MMRQSWSRYVLVLAAVVATGAACGSDRASSTGPLVSNKPAGPLLGLDIATPTLIQCPALDSTATGSALIGPLGGVISAGGVTVVIPANAVLGDAVTFTLTVPASQYVELQVAPSGSDHYTFANPVAVSIDYGRCGSTYDASLLTAWNIDPVTKQLLAPTLSADNKLMHTVTFVTDHFSGYAVAD